jgi:hypothetical protein
MAENQKQAFAQAILGGTAVESGTSFNAAMGQLAKAFSSVSATGVITWAQPHVNAGPGAIGYTTGCGGAITQLTSKSTAVTLNAATGTITTHNATLNTVTSVQFTLTNSVIGASDVVLVSLKSGNTAGSYFVSVDAVAAGSCVMSLRNYSAGNLGEAILINFCVLKGAAA